MLNEAAKNYIFDLDGTLLPRGYSKLSASLSETIADLNTGFSIATAKGYVRAREAIDFLPTIPLVLQLGGEIRGINSEVLRTFPLLPSERNGIADSIVAQANNIAYAAFYPQDGIDDKAILYVRTREIGEELIRDVGHIIRHATTNPMEYAHYLKMLETVMVEVSPFEPGIVILPHDLNVSTDGTLYVSRQGVNKGYAVTEMCDMMAIDLSTLVVAGDQETDVPMFLIPGVTSIAVGNPLLPATYHVGTSEELGQLLRAGVRLKDRNRRDFPRNPGTI